MQFTDATQLISAGLRRGTTLDEFIPGQMRLSMSWIETNYSFKYMERFRLLQMAAGDRIVALPDQENIKAMRFFRMINADGTFLYLKKVEPEDLILTRSASNTIIGQTVPANQPTPAYIVPTAYFQVGVNRLIINAITTQPFNYEVMYMSYSDTGGWLTGENPSHPILDVAPHLLIAQTLVNMSVNIMKDLRVLPAYEKQRDEAVNTLTRAEDETKYGGESITMVYDPAYDFRLANFQPGR